MIKLIVENRNYVIFHLSNFFQVIFLAGNDVAVWLTLVSKIELKNKNATNFA